MGDSNAKIPNPSWYLVYAKPRQEQLALQNLLRQGYEVYLPLLRNRGRVARRPAPMFPRYLFIRLTAKRDNFAPIRSTFGVSRLIRFGESYAIVPDEFITSLRAQADASGVIERSEGALVEGDPVRILDGAMAGYEALFCENVGRERVSLLLKIAERYIRVEASRFAVDRD